MGAYNGDMDKDLTNYTKQTTNQIHTIETALISATSAERKELQTEARRLYRHHVVRVRDFQHERLIHLLVTFFFGGLLLLSIAGGLFVLTLAADPSGPMLNVLAWSLCPILFVTEIFYVRHYYKLENGTQALYRLSERMYTAWSDHKSN